MKALLLLVLISVSAQADPLNPASVSDSSSKFDSNLLGGGNPVLSEQERAGIAVTQAWKDKSLKTLVSQPGANSSVEFRFGESLPSIVCAILQVTDIELQPGEAVTHINLGDSTRWSVESALSGTGSDQVEHLIVKPRDIGLSTSLVVTTDHRTYHLLLVSDEKDFFHCVNFVYGDEKSAAPTIAATESVPSALPTPAKEPAPKRSKSSDGKQVKVALGDLGASDGADENYSISGKADWKPIQVYTDGRKTYIEMPDSVKHREAPVLFEEKKAGWFRHEKSIVNYRLHGKWYVADRVLDDATLVSGVGSAQSKVKIKHVDKPKKVVEENNGTNGRQRP